LRVCGLLLSACRRDAALNRTRSRGDGAAAVQCAAHADPPSGRGCAAAAAGRVQGLWRQQRSREVLQPRERIWLHHLWGEGLAAFIHYTGIESGGGFKSLEDGEDVEFDIEVDHDGKQRAVRVTGPGGAPVRGSSRPKAAPGEEL
ncbi:unnamed protein product, partial [Prorocentrum cordatum]